MEGTEVGGLSYFLWRDMYVHVCSGVPPPGAGERRGAEPEFGSDADQLSEGDSGEAQDRAGRDQSQGPRDQQPADRPAGEESRKTKAGREKKQ